MPLYPSCAGKVRGNRVSFLAPDEDPPHGRYRAQWNDDYHHAWHVYLTGEQNGYYHGLRSPASHIARTLSAGFAYPRRGHPHTVTAGRRGGTEQKSSTHCLGEISCKTTTRSGKRALGERLTALCPAQPLAAALAILLLQPSPPLLFMGEESGRDRTVPVFLRLQRRFSRRRARRAQKGIRCSLYAGHGDDIPDPLSADAGQARSSTGTP